jgi:hypothetical protein
MKISRAGARHRARGRKAEDPRRSQLICIVRDPVQGQLNTYMMSRLRHAVRPAGAPHVRGKGGGGWRSII